MHGPHSLDEWIDIYVKRSGPDTVFTIQDGEQVVWWPEYGFLSYKIDIPDRCVIVLKMAGDGKYLRHKVFEMVAALEHLGFKSARFFSRREPEAYLRFFGGRLVKTDEKGGLPMYHYEITLDDVRKRWAKDEVR